MAVRWTIGLLWALLSGLTGGWLLLAPRALGEQPAGSRWTTVTDNEVGTGLGLILLAVICVAMLASQTRATLRETGWAKPRREPPAGRTSPMLAGSEMDQALIRLASALSADLERGRQGPQQQPPASRPPGPDPWERRDD
jgi:hypothetical protein